MRNDVKPVIPPTTTPKPARGGRAGAAYDAERNPSVRRERGDTTDPAGPKPSTVPGTLGTGGAVTDASGTTGPVSRSNDRQSTTTGSLGDRDMERSARMGEAPDIDVLNIPTGDSSLSVPVIMALLAAVIAILALVVVFSWPDSAAENDSGVLSPRDVNAVSDAE